MKTHKEFETILPKKNWYKKFEKYWTVGENEACKKLTNFKTKNIFNYDKTRDFPNIDGTSKLSPIYLWRNKFREYLSNIKKLKKNIGTRKFINEIGWREFAYHLVYHFPKMIKKI